MKYLKTKDVLCTYYTHLLQFRVRRYLMYVRCIDWLCHSWYRVTVAVGPRMLTQHLILKQKISHFLRSFFFSLLIFSVIILHSFHPLCLSRLWCISDMQINYGKMKKKKKNSARTGSPDRF